ncbi:MAG: metallophosphoesterase [Lachnospiraceae bacterium]|nr:metallophosphoesterase [Lachnospiraceae bacterium]
MKILVISDSHGDNNAVISVIKKEKPEMLIHLGDIENDTADIEKALGVPSKPAVFIRGNCDQYDKSLRPVAVFELEGHRFFASHGHLQRASWDISNLVYSAEENDCDIALYGHTHVPLDEEMGAVRVLNPGSISRPRGDSGKSYIIMEMDDDGEYSVEFKNI